MTLGHTVAPGMPRNAATFAAGSATAIPFSDDAVVPVHLCGRYARLDSRLQRSLSGRE